MDQTRSAFEYVRCGEQVSSGKGLCLNAEKLAAETIWIPGCSPTIQRQDLDDVAAAVRKVLSAYNTG